MKKPRRDSGSVWCARPSMSDASWGCADMGSSLLQSAAPAVNTAWRPLLQDPVGAKPRPCMAAPRGCMADAMSWRARGRHRYSEAAQPARSAPQGRTFMPEVVVYALGGRSIDQKRGLMKEITDAVVKNYSVPAEAVVVTLVETEKQDKMKGGVLFSEMKR